MVHLQRALRVLGLGGAELCGPEGSWPVCAVCMAYHALAVLCVSRMSALGGHRHRLTAAGPAAALALHQLNRPAIQVKRALPLDPADLTLT